MLLVGLFSTCILCLSILCGILSGQGTNIPDFSTTSKVSYVLENVSTSSMQQQFRFFCEFAETRTDLLYRADWYVNGVRVKESDWKTLEDSDKERTLTDSMLTDVGITSLGFDIYCEIRASYSLEGPSSLPSKSNPVFMGIEVLTPEIIVREGEHGVMQIRPTAEMGCTSDSCSLDVVADIPEPSEDQCALTVRADGACGVNIVSNRWNDIYTIKVTGVITQQYGKGTTAMKIILRSGEYYLSQPIWGSQILQPVTVYVTKDTTDVEGKQCSLRGQGRLYRFKRSETIYFKLGGSFIMYRQQDIEVQFQTTTCSSTTTGYCVCGVVVRVGRTAFMINRCHGNYWIIDYIVCDDGGNVLDIKFSNNYIYTISLPTGTEIEIRKYSSYAETFISPSVIDIGKTTGLCGPITGISDNRFELRDGTTTDNYIEHIRNWGVITSENLFDPNNRYNFPTTITSYDLCKCYGHGHSLVNDVLCEIAEPTQPCYEDADYKKVHQKRCISPKRKRRSLPNIIPDTTMAKITKRDLSWKNGWTADSSKEYCENLFNSSSMVNICRYIPGVDVTIDIEVCIQDIQISGSNMFSYVALSNVGIQCLREGRMNRTLRQPDEKHGYKSVFEMVIELTCPGECSSRGRCVKGVCVCNPGFIGVDCAVELNKAPLAVGVDGDGYCDVAEEQCDTIAVFGGTVVEHELTRCKLRSFEIKDSGVIVAMDTETVIPVVESDGEVTCPLPIERNKISNPVPIDEHVTGYRVSVSNNGVDYSEELTMVIINSECMNCNISGENVQCFFLPNYCIINNQCYKDGAPYSINPGYICRANTESKTWEKVRFISADNG